METLRAFALGNPVEPLTKAVIGAWARKQSTCQRTVVEAGPADENRQLSSGVDLTNGALGVEREASSRVDIRSGRRYR